jgi:hypothetical protein
MNHIFQLSILFFCLFQIQCTAGQDQGREGTEKSEKTNWQEVFFDDCTGSWQQNWSLDGTRATIQNTQQGMDYFAGPEHRNDTCHAVLWTKKSFEGDLKIEYEYTKLDTNHINVTILYIQATGAEPKAKDIFEWSDERVVPHMRTYFNNMNTLHISYAAFGQENDDLDYDYIRMRRYMPALKKGLKGTEVPPSYERTGLFKQGVPHKIMIIKKGLTLQMKVKNSEKEMVFDWDYKDFPPVAEGRIGLRHMYTRGARYKDFRVSVLQ